MAKSRLSIYDDTLLDDRQKKQIQVYKDAYEKARESGSEAGMASAHRAAESVRAAAGYSGGGDGGQYIGLYGESGYEPGRMESYQPQVKAAEDAYNRATEASLYALRASYAGTSQALENERAAIKENYRDMLNATEAENQRSKLSLNETAAASGLSSGAGTQIELSRNSAFQAAMGDLREDQAAAERDLDSRISSLKEKYNAEVASLRSEGERDKAAELLEEYRKAAESRVSTSRDQADENYRAYSALLDSRELSGDAAADAYKRAAENAEILSEYGDFSGYGALGYTDEQINNMERTWALRNPLLAYRLGRISAREYYSIVYG